MKRGRKPNGYTPVGDLLVNLSVYWNNQMPADANGCIPWSGGRHRQGYPMMGAFRGERRIMTVTHRITAMLKLGRALTSDEFVIHTCSNANCLNPDHLIVGDTYKKSAVMIANGRQNTGPRAGQYQRRIAKQNRQYKYSEQEILWVRSADTLAIAARYGIDRAKASKMRWDMRNNFKWLKGPKDDTSK